MVYHAALYYLLPKYLLCLRALLGLNFPILLNKARSSEECFGALFSHGLLFPLSEISEPLLQTLGKASASLKVTPLLYE